MIFDPVYQIVYIDIFLQKFWLIVFGKCFLAFFCSFSITWNGQTKSDITKKRPKITIRISYKETKIKNLSNFAYWIKDHYFFIYSYI